MISPLIKNDKPPLSKMISPLIKNDKAPLIKNDKQTLQDITNLNKTTTTKPDPESLPTVQKVVADSFLSPEDLKNALFAVDNRLVYDLDFCSIAASYLAEKGFGTDFISWMRDYCEKMNYRDFKSYFFKTFFKDNLAEQYMLSKLPVEPENIPPPPDIACKVCGFAHGRDDDFCPSCRLPKDPNHQQIKLYSELQKLPPAKRDEFLRRSDALYNFGHTDILKSRKELVNLCNEFGFKLTS